MKYHSFHRLTEKERTESFQFLTHPGHITVNMAKSLTKAGFFICNIENDIRCTFCGMTFTKFQVNVASEVHDLINICPPADRGIQSIL